GALSRLLASAQGGKARQPGSAAPAEVSRPQVPAAPAVSLRILVAEDNDFNAELVRELLRRRGHQPQIVANGNDVLSRLEAQHFDLLLLRPHNPRLDAFHVD